MTVVKISTHQIAIFLAAITSYFVSLNVPASEEPFGYEQRHTPLAVEHPAGGSTYTVDPHVWVYTTEFAKRWGMPEKWIDDSLQGAVAIAYKVVNETYMKCGFFRDPEACIPTQTCLFDFYISKNANLPWKDDQLQGYHTYLPHKSSHFLTVQQEKDYMGYDQNFQDSHNWYAERVGFDNTYYAVNLNRDKNKADNYDIAVLREFDRKRYQSMDRISVEGSCGFIRSTDRGLSEFVIAEPSVTNNKPTNYYEKTPSTIPIRHRVILPNRYSKRVRDYQQKNYGNHLWKAVKESLDLKD